ITLRVKPFENLRLLGEQTRHFSPTPLFHVFGEARVANGNDDPDDRNHDHDFDQGKTTVGSAHASTLTYCICRHMMRRLVPPTGFSTREVTPPLESLTILRDALLTTAFKVGIPPVKITPLDIESLVSTRLSPLVSSTA